MTPTTPELVSAAQSQEEAIAFIEAFAKINVEVIRNTLGTHVNEASMEDAGVALDWDDPVLLQNSGLTLEQVDDQTRSGMRYLHVDKAATSQRSRNLFLSLTGLSAKLQKSLFPILASSRPCDAVGMSQELRRLNSWLDWVRQDNFDPNDFITYQRGLSLHGKTQNLSGAIGATGAAIAFIDAIRQLDQNAIIDNVGDLPPIDVKSPKEVFDWRNSSGNTTVKALLLRNGRAIVFASSKDANIFQPLGTSFSSAEDALSRFNEVRNDQARRSQILHEFAVGEIKTATDLANLHERMGLASRETQTELRTDRFLMMAVLNREILEGGVQRRVMNNRDLTRFTHTFNLHHCWGWDGGRTRHVAHWNYFVRNVGTWCGLPLTLS